MDIRRGSVITVVLSGECGKPRPALVVQSELFRFLSSVTIVPITSDLRSAPLIRRTLEPSAKNGLRLPSQAMLDKIQTISRTKIGQVIGSIEQEDMLEITTALAVFLGLV